jgi:hypothetical protein
LKLTAARKTVFLSIMTVAVAAVFLTGANSADHPKPAYNSKGEMIQPQGYRQWVYVGTPVTPNDLNPPEAPFPEFHNVYIHPADFDHYEKTGEFPDGTVIIKELVSVGSKQAVSGNGYFMGDFAGLEATVKDSKRFPDEPGNWAYFSFGHSFPYADTAAAFPTAACNSCHLASAADDFVFTQYYPILRAAKGATGRTMSSNSQEYKEIAAAMTGKVEAALKPTTEPGKVRSVVPTDNDKLFKYLQKGSYKELAAQESATHPSRGPHSNFGLPVRVFLDPLLDASLKAGNASHPAGSAVVKEMFSKENELEGWAVMVKTEDDSKGGQGWFWYEITSTTDPEPFASGNGIPLCFGCHSTGNDYVLTSYPLQ